MKPFVSIVIIFLLAMQLNARDVGETEITTEDGIEVFQNEKYYLLKKNVEIKSDNFTLNANEVKINFDKSLYDIIELNAKGDVVFDSPEYNLRGNGDNLKFEVKIENLKVEGQDSELITSDIKMLSNGLIEVNNKNGKFSLKGPNSKLINDRIVIVSESIDGFFSNKQETKEIISLNVVDEKISYIKNNETEMYAKKITYDNKTSIIELIDSVTIIRNDERIIGDYGTLDTKNNSYKIKSSNQTKVKVIIQSDEQ